jgi:RimJ/RimL family protein N-acetyltransferase
MTAPIDPVLLDAPDELVGKRVLLRAWREDMPMGIWTRADRRLVGATGLHRFDWSVPSMEIGYWLVPAALGQGYATEAVTLIAAMAFDDLRAARVTIQCSTRNVKSAAVAMRCGFIHEATLPCERRDVDGNLRDTLVYALTRHDHRVHTQAAG